MERQKRDCIAVIISKPERKYQEGLLRGISQAAFARQMNVAVFATTLLEGMDSHQWGEQKIFDLINYEKFAGVIYAVDSFYGHEITQTLNERLREVFRQGIPVVTIDGMVEGLPCFYNDDTNAVKDVVSHLITEHKVTDIAYMTGHKGHPHAENSLKAYREAMAQYALPVLPDRIYYGDYWYNEAGNFVEQLLKSENGLPQAIVCANEYMAIGIYKVLHAKGIYVPKQILLGCASNDASTARYLLNGENSLENVGGEATNAVINSAQTGEKIPARAFYIPCKTILKTSVSCGCHRTSEYDYSIERGAMVDTSSDYFGECNFNREEMLSKRTFRSLFKKINANTRFIDHFSGIHFCMCDGWDDPHFLIGDTRQNPYTDRMHLYYSRKERSPEPEVSIGETIYFPREEMFPEMFRAEGEPSIYLFRALHFLDRNFGYMVMNTAQSSKLYEFALNFWLRDVANALEAQCRLQSVNYMYYTDLMTGLFNRNGFNNLIGGIWEEASLGGYQVLTVLADMNGLKYINDTFGHEEGDIAIAACAKLLLQQEMPGVAYERNFRIGGDEFVKIAVGSFTDESVQHFREALYASVAAFSQASQKPYVLQMSVGFCFGKADSNGRIDAFLSQADKRMYEEKHRLKAMNPPRR